MDAVEAAHDEMIDHVNHGLCERVVLALERVYAFLNHHPRHLRSLFYDRHLVALLAIQVAYVGGVFDAHDAHAIGPRIGLDDAERLKADVVFLILFTYAPKNHFDVAGKTFFALTLLE